MKFTDTKGREWDLTLTLAGAKRIDNSDFSAIYEQKFSILSPSKELFQNVLTNTSLLTAMVWAVVQPQVRSLFAQGKFQADPDTHPEDAEAEFCEAFNGATISACRDAFWEALASFFQDHQTVLLKLKEHYVRTQKKLAMRIQELSPELDSLMDENLDQGIQKIRMQMKESIQESFRGGT